MAYDLNALIVHSGQMICASGGACFQARSVSLQSSYLQGSRSFLSLSINGFFFADSSTPSAAWRRGGCVIILFEQQARTMKRHQPPASVAASSWVMICGLEKKDAGNLYIAWRWRRAGPSGVWTASRKAAFSATSLANP